MAKRRRKHAEGHEVVDEQLDEHQADDAAVAALLKNFEENLPHPEASIHGRYNFRPDDAWSSAELDGVDDGWYTDGAWSVLIHENAPVEAVRADIEVPEDAHQVEHEAEDKADAEPTRHEAEQGANRPEKSAHGEG